MGVPADLGHADPVVQEVIDTWLPRFLNGGIALGDTLALTASFIKNDVFECAHIDSVPSLRG